MTDKLFEAALGVSPPWQVTGADFDIDPPGSWMLGDNDSDLQAAAAAGVAGLWRLRPGTPLGELTAALASAVSPEGNWRAGGGVLKLRGFFPCP